MKYFLWMIAAVLIGIGGYAQQQLRFSKLPTLRIVDTFFHPSPHSRDLALISDTEKGKTAKVAKWSMLNQDYKEEAIRYHTTAKSISDNGTQTYISTITALRRDRPRTDADDQIYRTKVASARASLNDSLGQAKRFTNKAKVQEYYYSTTGRFNHIFQDSGGFVRNAIDAQLFYVGDTSNSTARFLNTTFLTIGTDGGTASLSNELYADYWGPVRVGVGVLLNNNQVSSGQKNTGTDTAKIQQDAIQTLIGGGSNGILNFSIPLISWAFDDNSLYFKTLFSPQVGANVPKVGTATNSPTYNWQVAVGGGGYYVGLLRILNPYFTYKFSVVGGSTDFYTALNKPDHKAFWLNQLTIGVALNATINIGYNIYYGDPFVTGKFPHSFSVSIMPK